MTSADEIALLAGHRSAESDTMYTCPFCGNLQHSPNGTGSDVSCCREVGHSVSGHSVEGFIHTLTIAGMKVDCVYDIVDGVLELHKAEVEGVNVTGWSDLLGLLELLYRDHELGKLI